MSRTPAIALTDVIVAYRRLPAVHHVSGRFAPGSLTAVAGPNGAGKSTLLKALMGLLPVSDGRIDRGGRGLQIRSGRPPCNILRCRPASPSRNNRGLRERPGKRRFRENGRTLWRADWQFRGACGH